jgi:hypothetical protein
MGILREVKPTWHDTWDRYLFIFVGEIYNSNEDYESISWQNMIKYVDLILGTMPEIALW